ncbi:sulfatase-like protein [Phytophthora cinnamomi]|uniref:sulfatase-like protein n=1 Tax=Phytophthora cinnamomi TaxID=4785 RepID=UPI003559CFA6|nr:sulfatase-like protein [Phytophthora cinnamomi]
MVHWGTVFVTVTAAGFLLGRRELPKIGRFVGLYSGRSVGAILRAKKEFFDATKDNDLVKLQREFQRGIEELNEIRSELTSVGSMRRPLQPTGVAGSPPRGATFDHSAAANTSGHTTDAATVAAVQQAQTAGRSSVSLASAAAYEMQDGVRRSAEASLAMAELKLAEQGKFAPRVESQEGGADYVSASIMDSLLLDQQKSNKAAT